MKKFRGLGLLIFLAVFAGVSALVMVLWNSVATYLFGVPEMNYWYAAGLLVLSKLLLGGWMNHGHHHFHRSHRSRSCGRLHHKRSKFCTDEELAEMHEKFHSMSGAERREYIRRHMAHGFHQRPAKGQQCSPEENRDSEKENG